MIWSKKEGRTYFQCQFESGSKSCWECLWNFVRCCSCPTKAVAFRTRKSNNYLVTSKNVPIAEWRYHWRLLLHLSTQFDSWSAEGYCVQQTRGRIILVRFDQNPQIFAKFFQLNAKHSAKQIVVIRNSFVRLIGYEILLKHGSTLSPSVILLTHYTIQEGAQKILKQLRLNDNIVFNNNIWKRYHISNRDEADFGPNSRKRTKSCYCFLINIKWAAFGVKLIDRELGHPQGDGCILKTLTVEDRRCTFK